MTDFGAKCKWHGVVIGGIGVYANAVKTLISRSDFENPGVGVQLGYPSRQGKIRVVRLRYDQYYGSPLCGKRRKKSRAAVRGRKPGTAEKKYDSEERHYMVKREYDSNEEVGICTYRDCYYGAHRFDSRLQ